MARTFHGHQIPGSPSTGLPPDSVARCGGPRLCPKCKQDVDEYFRENEVIVKPRETPERPYLNNQSKVEKNSFQDSSVADIFIKELMPTVSLIRLPAEIFQKIKDAVEKRFPDVREPYTISIFWFAWFDKNGPDWVGDPRDSWRALVGVSNIGEGAYYEISYQASKNKYSVSTFAQVSRVEIEG
ncbi:hypothetical protein SEA_CRICKO_68 [Streptomyces phage CricKo]|nr:hypothetical protein SEA_RAINYDAI_66 [Streptomyces phage Rainydai]QJD49951.1 hypothetical protein SEA_CRICKO_68 [Streptomyces phage CricKo]QNL30683.1 hypothetical protein SEA_THIQQUMS_68 [Streptomyces phage Thiqqums]